MEPHPHSLEGILHTLSAEQVKELTKAMVRKGLDMSVDYMHTIIKEQGEEAFNRKFHDGSFTEESQRLSATMTEDHILQWLKDHGVVAKDFVPVLEVDDEPPPLH